MHFKHPEILYFLFLLVIPILVHLFQLRRFKKEYFTNVRFLKALSIQTRKSSKLKKWLLLATRLLILTCLILAFAQPFFPSKDVKNSTNGMYVVLDNSFSMQAKGKKGELMKRAIQDLLENCPENQNFSLLTNSETFWNTDIQSIQKEIQNLNYSATPFQLESALAKIKSHKSSYNKDIVIITDAIGIEQKQLKSIDASFNLFFILPKAEQKNNVSIDSVFIQQTLNDFYEIGIKVSSYGNNPNPIPLALYNHDKLIAKTILKLESKEKIVNFTIPKEDFQGYATVIDGGLPYDNTLFFSISKPEKSTVISIGEAQKNNFLSRIFTPEEFNYTTSPIEALDYNLLEKQDAIVLNELKEIPQALQTTLKSFVGKGGNLVIIPSGESPIMGMNTFLASFGKLQFSTLQNAGKLITKINFNHPLYQSVFEKKATNFQYPNTKTSFIINGAYAPILSFEDQSIFLTSIQNQLSSVYVFSAPINRENSNFQNSPLIVPTFYNMAKNAKKTGVVSLTIGDNQPFLIESQLSKEEIVTVKNSIEKFIPIQQILTNKVKLTFNDYPEKAGNFGVFKQDQFLENISFNYNRTEGNLDQANKNILSDYTVYDSIESVFDTIQSNRTNNEIWKWFVILTLFFLVLEIFIQKIVK